MIFFDQGHNVKFISFSDARVNIDPYPRVVDLSLERCQATHLLLGLIGIENDVLELLVVYELWEGVGFSIRSFEEGGF